MLCGAAWLGRPSCNLLLRPSHLQPDPHPRSPTCRLQAAQQLEGQQAAHEGGDADAAAGAAEHHGFDDDYGHLYGQHHLGRADHMWEDEGFVQEAHEESYTK